MDEYGKSSYASSDSTADREERLKRAKALAESLLSDSSFKPTYTVRPSDAHRADNSEFVTVNAGGEMVFHASAVHPAAHTRTEPVTTKQTEEQPDELLSEEVAEDSDLDSEEKSPRKRSGFMRFIRFLLTLISILVILFAVTYLVDKFTNIGLIDRIAAFVGDFYNEYIVGLLNL